MNAQTRSILNSPAFLSFRPVPMPAAVRDRQIDAALKAEGAKAEERQDRFTDHKDGRASCHSKNRPEGAAPYAMRYAAVGGGRVVTCCKCKAWELSAKCRHGDQFNARLAAQDAAEVLLLGTYPGLRYINSAVQDKPCADCGAHVISAAVWGRWPLSDGTEVLAYGPVKVVCGCGIRDGGRL